MAYAPRKEIMGKLKLTVNEEKTRICKVPEGGFDIQSSGRRVRHPGIHVRANVFGEDRSSPYRLPAVKEKQEARLKALSFGHGIFALVVSSAFALAAH